MAIAETVLFYGVFVRTTALCFAADAYAYSKGVLLAIDMIRSRLRRGQLSFSRPSAAIARTPDEIWRKIQQVRVQCATLNSELMELRILGEMEDREIWADNWDDLFQDEKAELLFWEEGGIDSLVACRRGVSRVFSRLIAILETKLIFSFVPHSASSTSFTTLD